MFDDDVWRYLPLGPLPTFLVAGVGLAAAVYVTVSCSRAARTAAAVMLVFSVLVVLGVTARGTLAVSDGEFSWRLGESIRGELGSVNRALGLVNVFGNVALLVPVGWMAAVLSDRREVLVGVASALALSVFVELWQMISGSFGDVDDLVLNSLGGLVGATLAVILKPIRRRPTAGACAGPQSESAG
ncbi:VanZ family protein [Nocardioides okcheonensis]|uniref:VanZ family protein n=1 Tax=Nocardioides okcheonensis TaxID=2894081 RepID=UPI001E5AA72D|nr:VanZ family protein [Nocardioides okcheonensis]UFN45220.1 VanZ family protein [Nocardioides okcheonensis]